MSLLRTSRLIILVLLCRARNRRQFWKESREQQFKDLRFSRWRKTRILGEEVIVARQGVTGEVGYEFFIRTDTGKAHELWRTIRRTRRALWSS